MGEEPGAVRARRELFFLRWGTIQIGRILRRLMNDIKT